VEFGGGFQVLGTNTTLCSIASDANEQVRKKHQFTLFRATEPFQEHEIRLREYKIDFPCTKSHFLNCRFQQQKFIVAYKK